MRHLLLPILTLLLAACAHLPAPGPISATQLREAAPQFARTETADPAELASLQLALATKGPVQLTVYFADWCGDSIREVPRLLALVESVPADQLQLTLFNLDDEKTDPAGQAKAAGVLRIPTIIASQNGTELGRIVEKPLTTVGGDLIELLKSPHQVSVD